MYLYLNLSSKQIVNVFFFACALKAIKEDHLHYYRLKVIWTESVMLQVSRN